MPTTITSAGITFNDATTLTSAVIPIPANAVGATQIADGAVTNPKIENGAVTAAKLGTNEQKQIAKAWVNFDGTTSPGTIRSSYNVSSVTKNGTGNYTVNFATPMADANYSATATTQAGAVSHFAVGASKATGSYILVTGYVSSFTAGFLGFDVGDISVQIFGN